MVASPLRYEERNRQLTGAVKVRITEVNVGRWFARKRTFITLWVEEQYQDAYTSHPGRHPDGALPEELWRDRCAYRFATADDLIDPVLRPFLDQLDKRRPVDVG